MLLSLEKNYFFSDSGGKYARIKQMFKSKYSGWWLLVDYCDVLSVLWTLILTAPIHCRGSIAEQMM